VRTDNRNQPGVPCIVCGQAKPKKRARSLTCSPGCQDAHMAELAGGRRRRVESTCQQCGKVFEHWPGEHRKFCGKACADESMRIVRKSVCSVCGVESTGTRKTCGDECFAEASRRRAVETSTVEARSSQVRAKRRRHAKHAYRGKDKAEVIARLTEEQGGRCKVCGSDGDARGDGTRGLLLDHDHTTGKPRAMLCTRCNAALGMMHEDPNLILALASYAEAIPKFSLLSAMDTEGKVHEWLERVA
jgi:hypothetical protein